MRVSRWSVGLGLGLGLGLWLALVACSKSDPATPGARGSAADVPAATSDDSPAGLCSRLCRKAFACANLAGDQLPSCVTSCAATAPDKAKVAALEAASCDEVLAIFNDPQRQVGQAPTPPAPNSCTADCRGCVGDGTSCYAVAGGANGIPCDPCCCAPGGSAPTWRTE